MVRLLDQHVGDDLGVDVQPERGEAVVPLEVLRREEPRVGEAVDDLEQLAVRRRARRVARVARERDEPREAPRDVLERRRLRLARAQLRAERDQHQLLQRRRVLDRAEVGRVREEPICVINIGDGDDVGHVLCIFPPRVVDPLRADLRGPRADAQRLPDVARVGRDLARRHRY